MANIYLHFCLDLWFEKRIKPHCRGSAHLVRFVDDFVVGFKYAVDAREFDEALRERFARFNLELAEDKTRLLKFGRHVAPRCAEYGRRPDRFDFLGFTHVNGSSRKGTYAVIRIPSTKSLSKFLARTREWLYRHMHWNVYDQQRHLSAMLRGFYQYFSLRHCFRKLSWLRNQVLYQWRRALRHRGQRSRIYWSVLKRRPWFDLPHPHCVHITV